MKDKLFTITREDFEWETYCGSGPGGQNRNRRATAVRVRHLESGAEAVACDEREQLKNKVIAFKRITKHPKFVTWLKYKTNTMLGNDVGVEAEVDQMMQEKYLKIEYGPFNTNERK